MSNVLGNIIMLLSIHSQSLQLLPAKYLLPTAPSKSVLLFESCIRAMLSLAKRSHADFLAGGTMFNCSFYARLNGASLPESTSRAQDDANPR